MKTQNTLKKFAIAALSFSVTTDEWVQLTPDGTFSAADGRPHGLSGFLLNGPVAERLLQRIHARKNDLVVDYEHQTINAEHNGKPAPAAGWIDPQSLEYRPGQGLYARVRWTPAAQAHIKADEYRYLSPVMAYHPKTGEVLNILHVALTNFAAVDGMDAVEALRARFTETHEQEEDLVKREDLILMLGLTADVTDEQITAALKAHKQDSVQLAALRAELGAKEGEDGKEAIVALKAQATPDPAKFVPVAVVEALKANIAALQTNNTDSEVDGLVKGGLDAGKLLPAQTEWAKELGKSNVAALKAYLDTTPSIAALRSTQTQQQGQPPAQPGNSLLAKEELAVLKQLGISEADYLATKNKEPQ